MDDITTIFGAPGCGKTYYLLNLLEDLLVKYKPYEIAFVSFTRKGAYEGRDKAMTRFKYGKDDFPYFRTLHSIAFSSAHLERNDMMTKKDYKEFSNATGMRFTGYYTEDFNSGDDIYLFYYFLKKNNPVMAEEMSLDVDLRVYEYVERAYDKFKKQKGLIDYTDMLTFFVSANRALPVKIAIIDEAQDLTTLQWDMCNVAFRDCEHVFVAGDDDQAIYEWNGADVSKFLSLEGRRVILDRSYRMPVNILNFSRKITDMMHTRVAKVFGPNELGGDIFTYNDAQEIQIKQDESYYFLARNNCFLDRFCYALRKKGIIYNLKGVKSVDVKTFKAIRGYEYYRKHGKFKDEMDAIIVPQFLFGRLNKTLPWFECFNMDVDEIVYYRDILAAKYNIEATPNITISTVHGVKGGEADNVVLLLDYTRRVDENYEKHMDSELRCLYVACTRAKKKLHIVFSNGLRGYDNHMNINEMISEAYDGR